ncbi:beta strand repeat-containing protein, partial [Agrobacterium rosae]|uniref:beta strand repeat-containing protein n=1 Tax=Agrobacterium rosae TaxID=1972867 RepID=UPI0013563F65
MNTREKVDQTWSWVSPFLDGIANSLDAIGDIARANRLGKFNTATTLGLSAGAVFSETYRSGYQGMITEGSKQISSITGSAVGTALGSFLLSPLGPAGVMVGSTLGSYYGGNWNVYFDALNAYNYQPFDYPSYSWNFNWDLSSSTPFTKMDAEFGPIHSGYTANSDLWGPLDTPSEHGPGPGGKLQSLSEAASPASPTYTEDRLVPAGRSSSRLPGDIGLIPLGAETKTLDVLSEIGFFDDYPTSNSKGVGPGINAPSPLSDVYNTPGTGPKRDNQDTGLYGDWNVGSWNNSGVSSGYGGVGYSWGGWDSGSWASGYSDYSGGYDSGTSSGWDNDYGGSGYDWGGWDSGNWASGYNDYSDGYDSGSGSGRDNDYGGSGYDWGGWDNGNWDSGYSDYSGGYNGGSASTADDDYGGSGYDWGGWDDGDWGSGSDDYSGGYDTWSGVPVILDLAGNGFEIDSLESSSRYINMKEDGLLYKSAWAGKGNGVLVIDVDGDDQISRRNEFVFTEWDASASSDLEAIKNVFDSNKNGKLDAGDVRWTQFKVEIDGELKTLDELGIASIDLTPTGAGQVFADGSAITGTTTFTKTDGTTGAVGDAILASDTNGYRLQATSTIAANGTHQKEIRGFDAEGSLSFINKVSTSADGNSVETRFDDDADGTFDRSQTVVWTTDVVGKKTKVTSNFDARGALTDSTSVSTSADLKTVTTALDKDGDGLRDEEQKFTKTTDGSTSTQIRAFSKDGSVTSATTISVSADGLSKTTSLDLNGDGVVETIAREVTVVAADGSRGKTVSESGRNGKILATTATSVSGDRTNQSTSTDLDGDGAIDLVGITSRSVNAIGDITIETTTKNRDGSSRGKTTSVVSSSGLIKSEATDIDGDAVADTITNDSTVVAADGSRTQTVRQSSANGTVLSNRVQTTSGDALSRSISVDSDGDGAFDILQSTVTNSTGTTDSKSIYNLAGTRLVSRTTSVSSVDGLTGNMAVDVDGDGTIDTRTRSETTKSSDGKSTTTVTRFNGAGNTQLGKTVTTVSANGLDTLVENYIDSNQTVDSSTRTVKVLQADGTIVETTTSRAGSTQTSMVQTVTSADRKSTTTTSYLGTFSSPWKIVSSVVADDGRRVVDVKTFSPDGKTLVSATTTQISRDGLESIVTADVNGDKKVDSTTAIEVSLGGDGGRVEKVTTYAGTYMSPRNKIAETTTAVSGNGYEKTVTTDQNGDGIIDRRSSDQTTFGNDGSSIRTVSDFNGSGVLLVSKERTTTSANGLRTVVDLDADGDGTVDLQTIRSVVIAPDGDRTETLTKTNASGQLRHKSVQTVSGDGYETTSKIDLNGDGAFESDTTVRVSSNGDQITTQSSYSPDGTFLISKYVTTKSADGLVVTVQTDQNGDGVYDVVQRTARKINTDGSTTTTLSKFNGSETVRSNKTVTTLSADGLVETVQSFINGDDLPDISVVTTKTINADGSITKIVDQYAGVNGTKFAHNVSSISPDGRNTSASLAWYANLLNVQNSSGTTAADGSRANSQTTTRTANPIASKEIKSSTTSADGLSSANKLEVFDYDNILAYSETISSTKTLNEDGSLVEIQKDTTQTGAVLDQITTTTAANGLTQQRVWSGNHVAAAITTIVLNADGSRTTRTVHGTSITNGVVANAAHELTVIKSANGLSEQQTLTAAGKTIKSQSDVTSVDGVRTITRSFYNSVDGGLLRTEKSVESADGLSVTYERDTDGIGGVDYRETTTKGADGRTTGVVLQVNADGSVRERVTSVTSADGLAKTTSFDTNGDGQSERVISDVTRLNADGGQTLTHSEFAGDGTTLLNRQITTTSGDGLTKTTQIQTTGSGETDETQYDVYTIDANGNEVKTSNIFYKDGSKRSGFTVTTMRDGRTFTTFDYNGDGIIDQYQNDIGDRSGNRQQTIGYPTGISWRTGLADSSANTYIISEVDEGRSTLIDIVAPDDPANPGAGMPIRGRETIARAALLDGSYVWRVININDGSVTSFVDHMMESNNVDYISWSNIRGTTGSVKIEKTLENTYLDRMQRIYDVAVDRGMQNFEREQLGSYILNGALNAKQISTDILNGYEFKTYYGTLTNIGFIDILYRNAYGRGATLSETQKWLGQLNSGTLSRADLLLSIAESAEHIVKGNVYSVDNVTSGKFLHSTDTSLAGNAVKYIYNVLLDRDPSVEELRTQAQALTSGTKTQYQISSEVLASANFTSLYGSLGNTEFIQRLFQNAFARAATTIELNFWNAAITAGTTRADMAVVLSGETGSLVLAGVVGVSLSGTAANDLLVGGDGNDVILSLAGNDVILAGSGNDTLDGGAGADTLVGGAGNDTYVIDDAGDVVVENAGGGTDLVRTALASYTLGANVENLTYTGTVAFAGTGNALNNVIRGGAGADTLDGGTGNDTLNGGA